MIQAGIVGATGYAGNELVKLLHNHPSVQLHFVTSESKAGHRLNQIFPSAPALNLVASDDAPYDEVDVVFLSLPHGVSATTALTALDAGARVIDLSADFRLRDVAIYQEWYQTVHPAPELLSEAIYGLTEFARSELATATLVANPGCYPTSILLALKPLLQAGAVIGTVIADSKSGVSGAGRTPKQHTHFVEVADNFSPYALGRTHRHLPEIEQEFHHWHKDPPKLIFSPHLLPVPRGILSTIYVPVGRAWTEAQLRELYCDSYDHEPFVCLLPDGEVATLAHVTYSNQCALGLTLAGDVLIVTSAIDNLLKGAAGQAVQNMNVMFGLTETAGLP